MGNRLLLKRGGVAFEVKRVYYIWDTLSEVVRGKHSHKK